MSFRLIGGLRLALLFPLFLCLVVIDETARWVALGLYLLSALVGAVEARRSPTALARIADGLLLIVMTVGLIVGGVTTIGGAAAGAIIVGRRLVRVELALEQPQSRLDRTVAWLTVLAFALLLAPRVPGVPRLIDTHRTGGFLLMGCGAVTLVQLGVDLFRNGLSSNPERG